MMASDLVIDFNNMIQDRIGPEGISISEIEDLSRQAEQAFRGLSDLRRLGQLPYRDLPFQEDWAKKILQKSQEIRSQADSVLLLGTGGSSLGAHALLDLMSIPSKGKLHLEICEDLHPALWVEITKKLIPEKTFLIVVSKSGKTTETLAAFLFFRQWLIQHIGEIGYRKKVLFITDPREGPLRQIAEQEKIETLPVPPGVGGRYSVLSTVGLLPAAFLGLEIEPLLAGARRMDERCNNGEIWANPALMSALLHYLSDQKRGKKIRILMVYDNRLKGYADWYAQLWGESLGKAYSLKAAEVRSGSTLVRAIGSMDQHSQLQLYLEGPRDKTVTILAVENQEHSLTIPIAYPNLPELKILGNRSVHQLLTIQRLATEAALVKTGCPNMTIRLRELSPYTMGQLLYLGEVETVFAGALYDINPFDQPGVELIKKYIKGLLGAGGFIEYKEAVENNKKDRRFMI